MATYKIIYLSLLISFLSACTKDDNNGPSLWKPDEKGEVVPYTSEDATLAFDSFNDVYYNQNAGMYYATSEKNEMAVGWTQAIMYDIIMDAYLRTDDPEYLQMVKDFYNGANNAYSQFVWENVKYDNGWIYDDMMWWVISLGRAYEITNNQEYLDKAIKGFDFVWEESYDEENGGMIWSWKADGKVAAINYPTVIGAMELYKITGEEAYLEKAKEIYKWADDNLFQEESGRVADHKVGNNPPGFEDYTYNQGTCIGASVMLYKATGDSDYLDKAILAADYTKNEMCDAEGILPAEGSWNEQGVLKAIFARYLMKLIEDGGQDQYLAWLQKNGTIAWNNRDQNRDIMFRDYNVLAPILSIQSYEASSGVEILQVCPPEE
jgi:predicted alpha-1,6-mannanase (GH76 family)